MANVLLNHNNTMLACIIKEKQVYWNQFNSSLEYLVKRHYNVSNLPKAHYIDRSLSLFWSLNQSRVSLRSTCSAASERGTAGRPWLVRVHVEMHLEVFPNWQPSHLVQRKADHRLERRSR